MPSRDGGTCHGECPLTQNGCHGELLLLSGSEASESAERLAKRRPLGSPPVPVLATPRWGQEGSFLRNVPAMLMPPVWDDAENPPGAFSYKLGRTTGFAKQPVAVYRRETKQTLLSLLLVLTL